MSQEWLRAANDDIVVIDEIVDNPLVTNLTAFHCQQCLEKCFKAILEEYDLRVPKIHSLIALYEDIKGVFDFDFDEDILDKLDKLYIDARYPSEFGLLPYGKPTVEDAREFYRFTIGAYDKIKTFLENKG
jgi:HEPN domain-containing protein